MASHLYLCEWTYSVLILHTYYLRRGLICIMSSFWVFVSAKICTLIVKWNRQLRDFCSFLVALACLFYNITVTCKRTLLDILKLFLFLYKLIIHAFIFFKLHVEVNVCAITSAYIQCECVCVCCFFFKYLRIIVNIECIFYVYNTRFKKH